MTKLEELDKVKKDLNDIDDQIKELIHKQFELGEIKKSLSLQTLEENKLLKHTRWKVVVYSDFFNLVIDDSDDINIKNIEKVLLLLSCRYHDRINFDNKVDLIVNDNDIELRFDNLDGLAKFVEKYEIIINLDDLKSETAEHEEKAKQYKRFIKDFHNKVK